MLALGKLDITTSIREFIEESDVGVGDASVPVHTPDAWLLFLGSTVGQWQYNMFARLACLHLVQVVIFTEM
jgi:hypothetical protein